jgi:hypothetical protein
MEAAKAKNWAVEPQGKNLARELYFVLTLFYTIHLFGET